jgi:ketosteroid isomerase-like protein
MTDGAKHVVMLFFETVGSRGPGVAIQMYMAPGFGWWASGMGQIEGNIEALLGALASVFTDGPHFSVIGTTADEKRVALEMKLSGVLRDGSDFENQYHFLFEVEGGRIVQVREYCDTALVKQRLLPLLAG